MHPIYKCCFHLFLSLYPHPSNLPICVPKLFESHSINERRSPRGCGDSHSGHSRRMQSAAFPDPHSAPNIFTLQCKSGKHSRGKVPDRLLKKSPKANSYSSISQVLNIRRIHETSARIHGMHWKCQEIKHVQDSSRNIRAKYLTETQTNI